jgi:hypothetical protein
MGPAALDARIERVEQLVVPGSVMVHPPDPRGGGRATRVGPAVVLPQGAHIELELVQPLAPLPAAR